MKKKKYEALPHTADLRLDVFGKTLADLFENAAQGLFSFMNAPVENAVSFSTDVKVKGADAESLLVNWLNELLYLAGKKRVILSSFTIRGASPTSMEAEVWGNYIKPGFRPEREIKAATYHALKIRKSKNGFETKVVFDV